MARLQILQLPEGANDDMPPFLLVVDQYQPQRYILGPDQPEPVSEFDGVAEQIGARAVLVFAESIDIPANEPTPLPEADDAERAGITQIVYAHERTRLDLCSALLLGSGTTWRKLIEYVAERQRELADLYRKLDEAAAEQGVVDDADHAKLMAIVQRVLGITPSDGPPNIAAWLYTACRELEKSEAARDKLRRDREFWEKAATKNGELYAACENQRDEARRDRDEARQWARHGYEIGQRHCSWSDYGVAPDWLTEGWPRSFGSCEHLQQAASFDEALTRVRNLSTEPELMNADQEHPGVWRHGYECGVRAAKSASRPRYEETEKP